jgi:transcriptional regulator with XRE-family HTH domain
MFERNVFGAQLRLLRKKAGIKQSELGEAVGLSLKQISNMEIGRRSPSVEVLVAIADYFKISLDSLVGRDDP